MYAVEYISECPPKKGPTKKNKNIDIVLTFMKEILLAVLTMMFGKSSAAQLQHNLSIKTFVSRPTDRLFVCELSKLTYKAL